MRQPNSMSFCWAGDGCRRVRTPALHVVRRRSEDRVVAAVGDLKEPQLHARQVRQELDEPKPGVHLRLADGTGHDRFVNARPAEHADPSAEPHDARPVEPIGQRFQCRIGQAAQGHDDHGPTRLPGSLGHQERKTSGPGDDTQWTWLRIGHSCWPMTNDEIRMTKQ
jgi:hypothetical protein